VGSRNRFEGYCVLMLERLRQPLLMMVAALCLIATLWAPVAWLEAAFVVAAVLILAWTARLPAEDLRRGGRLRALPSVLGLGVLLNAYAVMFLARPALFVSLALLGAALVVGLVRLMAAST
jgi:hypothetical protein